MSIKRFCKLCIQLLASIYVCSGFSIAQELSYEIAPWYQWKKAATVLTYDDWSVDHPLIAIPELNKRNMKGTFFVNGWAFEMLAQDIIEASSQGHEIGNHTEKHVNLLNEGPAVFDQEIVKFQQRLSEALPNDNCETFSYPFGAGAGDDLLSLQIQSLLRSTHIGARAVIDQVWGYDFGGSDYYKLPALVIRDVTTVEIVVSWNEEAIQRGGLAVIMYHKVDGSNGNLTVTREMYEAQLDAINQMRDRIWLATFKNMIKYHKEANSATLSLIAQKDNAWELNLTDRLDDKVYTHPLSIKVKEPENFEVNYVIQGERLLDFNRDQGEIYFEAIPDSGVIIMSNELVSGVRQGQSISFDPIENKKTIDQPFQISASASSGLPVQFSITEGPATLDGNTIILTGKSGTVTVKASQPGNLQFTPAPDLFRSFEVVKVNQSITFDVINDKKVNDPPFEIKANASSGLPVSLEVVSGPASLNGNMLTLQGDTGTVVIRATQAGNDSYRPALDAVQTFNVQRLNQIITMDSIPEQNILSTPFVINASSSSELPVALEIVSGPATLKNDTCILEGIGGIVTIRASQSGNEIFQPAEDVVRSFEVQRFNQEISFNPIEDKQTLDDPFTIDANASSGLPVTLSILEGPAYLVNDTIFLTRASGQVNIIAEQAGNEIYDPAEPVTISFLVDKTSQEITFDPIPNQLIQNDSVVLYASASSGLPVNYKMVSGPAFIRDSVVFYTGFEGKVVVQAVQDGDSTYQAATPVERSFLVGKTLTVNNANLIDSDHSLRIYPNPASNLLNLSWDQHPYPLDQFEILTLEGKLLLAGDIPKGKSQTTLSLDCLPMGTYLLQITDINSSKYVKLFVKP